MLSSAIEKLDSLRYEMPTAGGLVIAPNIEMAEFMAKLIELLDGEKPIVVHSDMTDPGQKINAFRNSDRRWLVSVAMVSEGVDIRRLRVLVYLPNALTELAFRQAVGRVIRTSGYNDMSRAYIVIPALKLFEDFARRVEEEMPQSVRQVQESRQKVCPACGERNDLSARSCACGHEFPIPKNKPKTCQECGTLNVSHATSCEHCGASFESLIRISLDEALRNGAIARGLDLDEDEVREAERNAAYVKNLALKSGDDKIIKLIRLLPEETWSRLRSILETSSRNNASVL
jgi:superfamily II DNA or RNA helicase